MEVMDLSYALHSLDLLHCPFHNQCVGAVILGYLSTVLRDLSSDTGYCCFVLGLDWYSEAL